MKEVRIVSIGGKISARWVGLDKDGEVEFVPSSPIELVGDVRKVYEGLGNALSKPIITMPRGKHSGYLSDDSDWLEEEDEG